MKKQDPRKIAFDALMKIEAEGAYSNIALDSLLSKTDCDTRDRAFVSNLFYGVIERKLSLEYQIALYVKKPLNKMKKEVLMLLRLGAYQLLYMDKVPSSAAINETVELAKKNGLSFASGLINAVLHKIDNNGLKLPSDEDFTDFLAVKYSCPHWLINKWIKEYGKTATEKILKHSIGSCATYIRVNNTRISAEELSEKLNSEGVKAKLTPLENCLEVSLSGKSVEELDSFKKGYFHVQDISCQLCAAALKAKSGDIIFDVCAAPGGKTYSVAELMNNDGKIFSFDIHQHRVELIKKGAERLGLTCVNAEVGDATVYNKNFVEADVVLCDVPCSGFGIIGRKPEIKYKNPDEVKQLPALQLQILQNCSRYVKSGGRLVYSTCTLSKSENEKVCRRFLSTETDFEIVKPFESMDCDDFLTILPDRYNSDGFFIACFERKTKDEN